MTQIRFDSTTIHLPPPADLTGYFTYVARQIASRPTAEHLHQLGLLLAALRLAGVDVEILECVLTEVD